MLEVFELVLDVLEHLDFLVVVELGARRVVRDEVRLLRALHLVPVPAFGVVRDLDQLEALLFLVVLQRCVSLWYL